jgi:hypothetical protein
VYPGRGVCLTSHDRRITFAMGAKSQKIATGIDKS